MADSKPEDDILNVACMRVKDSDLVVPGSLQKSCTICERAIWVSPATLAHIRDKPHRFLCIPCMMETAKEDDDNEIAMVMPEQIEELKMTFESQGLTPPSAEDIEELKQAITSGQILPQLEEKLPGLAKKKQKKGRLGG